MPKNKASDTLDLFSVSDLEEARVHIPATVQRVVVASDTIQQELPDRADFLHSVLCQVGMPRRKTEGRTFERESGSVSIMLEAGRLWNGRKFVQQLLPYGTRPRLVMVHISSEAVRTQSRIIEIGESISVSESHTWAGDPAALKEQFRREQALLKAELARLAGNRSVPATVGVSAGADPEPVTDTTPVQFTFRVPAGQLSAAARAVLRRHQAGGNS